MITVTRNGRLVTIAVPPEPPPSVVTRFGWIIKALMRKVGERSGKIPDAILVQIYYRLNLILQRFIALAERVEAGLVRPVHPRSARAPSITERPPPQPPDPYKQPAPFPRDWAWVVRYVPYEASAFGAQLANLFNEPEMATLLARSPGLRRMLRPLMRALAQPPHPALRDPPREAPTAEPAAAASVPAAVETSPGGSFMPLPDGGLARSDRSDADSNLTCPEAENFSRA
jgi:hypothetical protein